MKRWLISNVFLQHVWTDRTKVPFEKKTFNNMDTFAQSALWVLDHFYDDSDLVLLSTHIRISYCIIPFLVEVAEFFHS